MKDLNITISSLKKALESINTERKLRAASAVEGKIREITKAALARNDLRFSTEMLLSDIYNAFLRFDRFDMDTKQSIVNEAIEKTERLEFMDREGSAVMEEVSSLPPPPDYALKEIEKEKRKIAEENALRKQMEKMEQEKIAAKRREEPTRERNRKRKESKKSPSNVKRETTDRNASKWAKSDKNKMEDHSKDDSLSENRKNTNQRTRSERQEKNKHTRADSENILDQPVTMIPGIGNVMAERLRVKNIENIRDLLLFLPRDYEDRRKIVSLKEIQHGQWATSVVTVNNITVKHPPGRKSGIIVIHVSDDTGRAFCKFFGGKLVALKSSFPVGQQVVVSGEVEQYRDTMEFHHPDSEILPKGKSAEGKIVSVYSETSGISRRRIRGFIRKALDIYGKQYFDAVPEEIRKRQKMTEIKDAIKAIHFPSADSDLDLLKIQASDAHRRLVFEELFLMQLGVAVRKNKVKQRKGKAFRIDNGFIKKIKEELPFRLTGSQRKTIDNILSDLKKNTPMNRLLQGDVGSGKTVDAVFAAAVAMQNGYQFALMVPTEILAEQHFIRLSTFFNKFGFKIGLLTGKSPMAEQKAIRKNLQENKLNGVVGTHSLIQETTAFSKLGLVVVDEQHRFGVSQRRLLVKKGEVPHLLTMTATPIPRTLAMTAYGDMDISIISEKPSGRKSVITKIVPEKNQSEAFEKIRNLLKAKKQGFIIYPVVEDNERGLLNAKSEAENFSKNTFKEFSVGLLHGKMASAEKEKMVLAFRDGRLNLLVSTTVIEVGIDLENASFILVEHAERFGLAQLHQLRGRVGRNNEQGYCYLIAHDTETQEAISRLSILEKINDGLKLAEKDMEIRGQGDILGTKQHGLPNLRIADLIRDRQLFETAKKEAEKLLSNDSELKITEDHKITKIELERWWGSSMEEGLMD